MTFVTQKAPAKINLYLHIAGRRADGYHEIETLFQRVDLHDTLEAEQGAEGVSLECRGLDATCEPADNLVVRAFEALKEYAQTRGETLPEGVRFTLEKRIPAGAGLGGGSSDAAAALKIGHSFLAHGLSVENLQEVGRSVGADVPFFLGPPCAVGRGIGERLEPVAHGAGFFVVIALPEHHVSTAEVYRRYDPEKAAEGGDLAGLLDALGRRDMDGVLGRLHNSMEPLAFAVCPVLRELQESLMHAAARPVRMSGSGSAFFTLAGNEREAERIAAAWRPLVRTYVTRLTTESEA